MHHEVAGGRKGGCGNVCFDLPVMSSWLWFDKLSVELRAAHGRLARTITWLEDKKVDVAL